MNQLHHPARQSSAARHDAFLVRDLNGNGKIDNGGELFGTNSGNGFVDLAAMDTNGDGVVSSSDTGWTTLRVWQDVNSDGKTQAGELFTLEEKGIRELSVHSQSVQQNVQYESRITDVGTANTTDGATIALANMLLNVDTSNTRYAGDYTLDIRALVAPDLRG